jgi:hypothetical protein
MGVRIGTDEYMRRVSYGVLVLEGDAWAAHVPVHAGGAWTIGGQACAYVKENVVRVGGVERALSTPSYAQWARGLEVARELARIALEAWAV